MGLLNTYKVWVAGYLEVEASSAQVAVELVEDTIQHAELDAHLTVGDVFQSTNYQ